MTPPSPRIVAFEKATRLFSRFFTESTWARRSPEERIADFVFGNPHDLPSREFVGALQRAAEPKDKDWFAYKNNEPAVQKKVAASLQALREQAFEAEDVFLTTGAFSAIAVLLAALTEPEDEVIFLSPPWFFYEAMIAWHGATAVRVPLAPPKFDLDLGAISRALGPKTRAIIVNSPHNPSGRVLPPDQLQALAELLRQCSARNGRPVYLLSDESYSRIVFDSRPFASPCRFYADSLLIYTSGKTLLTPGQRFGYVALSPEMPEREPVRRAIFASQLMTGWAFPNALLQHAFDELDPLSIDLSRLQRKRDRMYAALSSAGYTVDLPESTFYMLPRSPWPDDWAFVEHLAQRGVYCLPGSVVELPGYFRLSLTANEAMIEQAVPILEQAAKV